MKYKVTVSENKRRGTIAPDTKSQWDLSERWSLSIDGDITFEKQNISNRKQIVEMEAAIRRALTQLHDNG
ncbi:hypothetical protein KGQ33_05385 [Patescibacteria group bacterium]|nr:hypothetical protein [Patescibacteria group bacterium]